MKVCKYCLEERPDEAFEVCRIVAGKAYRRLRCGRCKRLRTNERKTTLRVWLTNYKKTLACARCGFADFRALEFHHDGHSEKEANVADMVGQGLSVEVIKNEIDKCIVLCSNCHRIEHYEERH